MSQELYTMTQRNLSRECKTGSTVKKSTLAHKLTRLKKKNRKIVLIDSEKAFNRIQHPFVVKKKNPQQTRNREELHRSDTEYLQKSYS